MKRLRDTSMVMLALCCSGGVAAPQQPRACAALEARYTDGQAEVLDTGRIQEALDRCNPGMAVVLRGGGEKSAFLSAPLILPRGITLWISAGAILYASRNPRDYDLAPGSCGPTRPAEGQPAICKPFIYSYQAAFSGVAGGGTIDGQDVAPELVSSYESQGFHVERVTLRNALGTHLAIYKTTAPRVSGVLIESRRDSADAAGILLSNAVDAKIGGVFIRVPGEALAIKASILGGTTGVDARDLNVFGGRGIAIGDDVYGSVRNVTFDDVKIAGAANGVSFNSKGTLGGQVQQIVFRHGCLRNVAVPLRGVPEGRGIEFLDGVWDGKQSCEGGAFPERLLPPEDPDLPALPHPGTARSLTVGAGGFRTIQEAVDALPLTGGEIAVKPGVYREVVSIRKPHVHLHGEGDASAATIVFNHGPSYGGTFASATVFVEADDATVDHLTIANDLGAGNGQGVALAVTADRAIFRNLRLLGAQDTLFAASRYCYGDYGPCVAARQYFADCYIEGNTDFIFGDSMAVFDRCELHGIATGSVMYTAQSRHTEAQHESGYVFDHCRITGEPREQPITLGRPWRPYATVVFLEAQIEAPVNAAGWTEWTRFGKPSLPTAYYAEYRSRGPGANAEGREGFSHQLTAAEAERWRANRFLAGADGFHPAR